MFLRPKLPKEVGFSYYKELNVSIEKTNGMLANYLASKVDYKDSVAKNGV